MAGERVTSQTGTRSKECKAENLHSNDLGQIKNKQKAQKRTKMPEGNDKNKKPARKGSKSSESERV